MVLGGVLAPGGNPQAARAATAGLVAPAQDRRSTYQVDLREAQGVQFGDGNTQHNTFG